MATLTSAGAISRIIVANEYTGEVLTYLPNGTQTTPTITGLAANLGVAFDSSGNIYATSQSGYSLKEFSPTGTLLRNITTGFQPSDVFVDPAGKIYVTNDAGESLTTYLPNGTQTTPTITNGVNHPWGVAVDSSGNIYCANYLGDNVTVYNSSGTLIETIPTPNQPDGVAIDSSGKIYVSSLTGNSITTYLPNGTPTTPTISSGLSEPEGVAVDSAGNIYVANFNGFNVKIYNSSGTLTSTISTPSNPTGIAVH